MYSIVHMSTPIQSSFIPYNNKADAPIGVFDSGIGGLSVALEILKYLPKEHILYYADTANVPYGAKSDDEIRQLTADAIDWLFQQGCKIAVVACNSASAFSLDSLRQKYGESFPIIGLVPAVKPAVIHSQTRMIGVLATPATFRGKLIKDVIDNFATPAGVEVIPITCLDLVPLVENGQIFSETCLNLLKTILDPIVNKGVDELVLGCTHYPFLKPAIESIYGDRLNLIDSGQAVARQCGRILQKHYLLKENIEYNISRIKCVMSGNNSENMRFILQNLLGKQVHWQISDLLARKTGNHLN